MDPLWPFGFNMWLNALKSWQQINGNQTLTSLATLQVWQNHWRQSAHRSPRRQAYRHTEADPIFACTVSKSSSFTISSNVFIGKENSAAGLQSLNDLGGNIFMVQVQITESFHSHQEPCGVGDCNKSFFFCITKHNWKWRIRNWKKTVKNI